LKEKSGGVAPVEQMLWHGTSDLDPRLILESEEGFDMRFSREGLWGKGIYFAVDASYSNNGYAYNI